MRRGRKSREPRGLRAGMVAGLAMLAALAAACDRNPDAERSPEGQQDGAVAAPAAAGFDCPPDRLLELDLAEWRRALPKAASDPGELGRLLAQAGMKAVEPDGEVSIETAELRPGEPRRADTLVRARFSYRDGAESLRAAVLRPLEKRDGAYCLLGDELSHDTESGEEPCLTEHTGPARELSWTQVIRPDRDTLVVHDAGGWCGGGPERGDRFSVEYWGVEQGRLVRYFEGVTYEAWYRSPSPPVQSTFGEVTWEGGWPKTLVYARTVECSFEQEQEQEQEQAQGSCEPSEQTTRYRYRDGGYVAVSR